MFPSARSPAKLCERRSLRFLLRWFLFGLALDSSSFRTTIVQSRRVRRNHRHMQHIRNLQVKNIVNKSEVGASDKSLLNSSYSEDGASVTPVVATLKGTYVLENVNAVGRYLGVREAGKVNGARIVIWDDPKDPRAQWQIAGSNGKYTFENVNAAGKYIAVSGSGTHSKHNGANIILWDEPNNPDNQWRLSIIDGKYLVENVNAPGKYMAVRESGTHINADVLIWDNPKNPDTQWRLKRITATVKGDPNKVKKTNESPSMASWKIGLIVSGVVILACCLVVCMLETCCTMLRSGGADDSQDASWRKSTSLLSAVWQTSQSNSFVIED